MLHSLLSVLPFPYLHSLDDHARHPIWQLDNTSSSQAAAAATESGKCHFDEHRRRGGEALLAYQSNECMRGHTVSGREREKLESKCKID